MPCIPFAHLNSRQSALPSFCPSEQPLALSPCSHEGPVWQVAWAHPMYGNILASCSYDRKVIIWKEENGTWEKTHEHTGHDSSGTAWGVGRAGAAAGGSVHSGGKVLRPKANTKHNKESKDKIVSLVGWFFL